MRKRVGRVEDERYIDLNLSVLNGVITLSIKHQDGTQMGQIKITNSIGDLISALTEMEDTQRKLIQLAFRNVMEDATYQAWVEELCVINHIEWDHSKPHQTLCALIETEIKMALDPKISDRAVEIIKRYGGEI